MGLGSVLLVLFALSWLLLTPGPLALRPQFVVSVLSGSTNSSGPSQVILRIANEGIRPGDLFPVYGVEARPPKVDPTMVGVLGPGVKRLVPGEACTNTIALPAMPGRSWRVSFRYFEVRRPLWDFGRYWLRQAGLARREEAGFLVYTKWIDPTPGVQLGGEASGNLISVETNGTSSATGSGR
jgi:hypothetical protein